MDDPCVGSQKEREQGVSFALSRRCLAPAALRPGPGARGPGARGRRACEQDAGRWSGAGPPPRPGPSPLTWKMRCILLKDAPCAECPGQGSRSAPGSPFPQGQGPLPRRQGPQDVGGATRRPRAGHAQGGQQAADTVRDTRASHTSNTSFPPSVLFLLSSRISRIALLGSPCFAQICVPAQFCCCRCCFVLFLFLNQEIWLATISLRV